MQVVIEIDEELYNYMQTDVYNERLDKRFDYQIRFAVKDGTPLPKGLIGEIDNAYFQGYKDAVDGKFRNIMMERIKNGVKYEEQADADSD